MRPKVKYAVFIVTGASIQYQSCGCLLEGLIMDTTTMLRSLAGQSMMQRDRYIINCSIESSVGMPKYDMCYLNRFIDRDRMVLAINSYSVCYNI